MAIKPSGLNNDLGSRVTYPTAIRLAELYRQARTYELSQDHSAQYAIRGLVYRTCHSRYTPITLDNYLRYYVHGTRSSRYDVSYARLVSLVASAIAPCEMNPDCLETGNPEQYLASLYLATGKGKRHREVTTATGNYRTITGMDGTSYILQSPRFKRAWLQFRYGRDLFILGPFDIRQAIEAIDLQEKEIWGIHPNAIMAQGYGMPDDAIAEEIHADIRLREYVRRYLPWFRETNWGHWYEISRGHRNIPIILDLPPEQMHLRALDLLQNPKPEKLEPMWPWVAANAIKQISPTDRLVPVGTYENLKTIGKNLHNCAANYGYLIQSKQALLVTYYRAQKPTALCQYDTTGKIVQVFGPCNTKVSKDTLQAFKAYVPNFNPRII